MFNREKHMGCAEPDGARTNQAAEGDVTSITRTRLVFIHVPKSGGTSTRRLLTHAFGKTLLSDYSDDPALPESPVNVDPVGYFGACRPVPPQIQCVYGHFHGRKYDSQDALMAAFLRHPVDTIISIYFYWKSQVPTGTLHRYFAAHQLSVTELARLPLLQRLLSQTYFGGFDIGRLALIGRHDARMESLTALGKLIAAPLPEDVHENRTVASEERGAMEQDMGLRAQLTDILREDVALYERWGGRDV